MKIDFNIKSSFLWIFYLSSILLQQGYANMTSLDFVVVWNVPIHKCTHLNISMDLWKYNIVYNENGSFTGENMTIFYQIGKFPFITESGSKIDGGIPQLGQLRDHATQVTKDIANIIPNPGFQGFGVIDWEEWRPSWYTNWGPFYIYKQESRQLVRDEEPYLSLNQIEEKAQFQFENAARLYMQWTIMIGRFLRPQGIWGYYGFPDCYNYEPLQKYCSDNIQQTNDDLSWLYSSSSALFPSIYISDDKNVVENAVYVYGKLNEAKRVAKALPVYPYSSIHYRNNENLMSEKDLLITVGQAAALRLPGIILWGAYNNFNSATKCETFRNYVHSTLGPTLDKMRAMLENNTKQLHFSDSLNNELWAEKILEFYQYDK